MSEENVEVIRRAFEAWNAGDMERLGELYDPDAIMRAPPGWPEPGPFVGRDAIMEQFSRVREALDSDSAVLMSDFLSAGDRVLVRFAWKGAGYGPAMNVEWTLVYTVRRRLIFGLEYFWDHGEALEAVGLSE
jgi:ketosteroid isomerase-like protein